MLYAVAGGWWARTLRLDALSAVLIEKYRATGTTTITLCACCSERSVLFVFVSAGSNESLIQLFASGSRVRPEGEVPFAASSSSPRHCSSFPCLPPPTSSYTSHSFTAPLLSLPARSHASVAAMASYISAKQRRLQLLLPLTMLAFMLLSISAHPLQQPSLSVVSSQQQQPHSREQPIAQLHLSHHGLYINRPTTSALDSTQLGITQPLTLYVDPNRYDIGSVVVHVLHRRRRTWEDVARGCEANLVDDEGDEDYNHDPIHGGQQHPEQRKLRGSIEACEAMDLASVSSSSYLSAASTSSTNSSTVCIPHTTTLDGRALFGSSHAPLSREHNDETPRAGPPLSMLDTEGCRLIEGFLGRSKDDLREQKKNEDEKGEEQHEILSSLVLRIRITRAPAKNHTSHPTSLVEKEAAAPAEEKHHFWLGHLSQPPSTRARWPLAGNAHDQTGDNVAWTGKVVNRLAGMMYDPYIPFNAARAIKAKVEAEEQGNGEGEAVSGHVTETRAGSIWKHYATQFLRLIRMVLYSGSSNPSFSASFFSRHLQTAAPPRSSVGNVLKGVAIDQSRWNLGISIRSPFNTSPNASLTEAVHSPVAGQVVWIGTFRRGGSFPLAAATAEEQPPEGRIHAQALTEMAHLVMVRDEWGFVWYIGGVEEETVRVQVGQDVSLGQVIAKVKRQGRTPPSSRPQRQQGGGEDAAPGAPSPSDPYRFKSLKISVARPDVRWTEWPAPYAAGWTFYDPLNFLYVPRKEEVDAPAAAPLSPSARISSIAEGEQDRWRSSVPPYANPTRIFFAHPLINPLNESLRVFASSTDLVTPTLTGRVQIIVSFDTFVQTPGDRADAMDGTGLYAMQWGLIKGLQSDQQDWDPERCEFVGNELDGTEWRIGFEHDRVSASRRLGGRRCL